MLFFQNVRGQVRRPHSLALPEHKSVIRLLQRHNTLKPSHKESRRFIQIVRQVRDERC